MALWSSAWVIPGLVGPAVAGFIAETIGLAVGLSGNDSVSDHRRVADGTVAASGRSFRGGGPRDSSRLRDACLLAAGTAIAAGRIRSIERAGCWLGLVAIGSGRPAARVPTTESAGNIACPAGNCGCGGVRHSADAWVLWVRVLHSAGVDRSARSDRSDGRFAADRERDDLDGRRMDRRSTVEGCIRDRAWCGSGWR